MNECLSVEDTLRVLEGRTIHAFHIEGCGGGHVPNVLKMAGVPNVIGSSTNPTLPFGRDAVAEHYGMIVSVHDLKTDLPGDAAMARDRIRAGTMAPRTSCTTWARSASPPPTRRAWAARARPSAAPSPWPGR